MITVYLYPAEATLPAEFPVGPPPGENFFGQLSAIVEGSVEVCLLQVDGQQARFLIDDPFELAPAADYIIVEPSPDSPDITDGDWRYLLTAGQTTLFADVLRTARARQSARDRGRKPILRTDDSTLLESELLREEGGSADGGSEIHPG